MRWGAWASLTAPVVFAFLAPPTTLAELRFDWTDAERRCAASLGIDLYLQTEPSSPKFIEHLAWLADHIAYVSVTEIKHDIRGAYPTLVKATVLSSLKGGLASGAQITIPLESGPIYSEAYGTMLESTLMGEATFSAGKQVLVFLTTSYPQSTEDPQRYALRPNHYALLDGYKFDVMGTSVTLAEHSGNSFSISTLNARIASLLSAKQSNCEGAP